MKIQAKSFFTVLSGGRPTVKTFELPEGTTAEEVIKEMKIDISDGAIILINGRPSNEKCVLVEGDDFAVMPPVSAA
jgi:sulfur carrier protein ThiS